MRAKSARSLAPFAWRWAASTAAHRTRRDPCLSVGFDGVNRSVWARVTEPRGWRSRPGGPARRGSLDSPVTCCGHAEDEEARQGFLYALPLVLRSSPFLLRWLLSGECGRPCLSRRSASERRRLQDGVRGVPTNVVAAAHSWSAVQQGWQQQGCGELVADHRFGGRRHDPPGGQAAASKATSPTSRRVW